jgi:hypothetical protein
VKSDDRFWEVNVSNYYKEPVVEALEVLQEVWKYTASGKLDINVG